MAINKYILAAAAVWLFAACSSEVSMLGIPYEEGPRRETSYYYNPAYPSDYETIDKLIQKHQYEDKVIEVESLKIPADGGRYVRYLRYKEGMLYIILDDGFQYSYDQITRSIKRGVVNALIYILEGPDSNVYYSIKEKER